MILRNIAGIITLLLPLTALADGVISGSVVNKDSGQPMDFVTVQLIDAKSGKPLPIGVSTDEEGHFKLPSVKDGEYIIKVSNVGSIDQERPVTVAGADVKVGRIKLADDAKMLQEVVVEGVKSQMRFELDRKVFQVDANVAAAGLSASELLESIPSVEVDQDGEVSLRGSTSVTVWINGKESGLSADNRAQILEQIPAETIERVEVITNPSAKYSPEGTSGIINIVLKKDRRAGYFGSAEIGANSRGGGNAGVSFNYNSSRWDTYASVGFRMRHNNGGSLSRRDYTNGNFLYSDGESRNHGNNIFVRAGATYHLSEKDDFYINAFGMFGHRWGHSDTRYDANLPGQWHYNDNYSSNCSDNRGTHAELGYTRRWSDTHTLDILAGFNYWGGPQSTFQHQEKRFADSPDEELFQEQDQSIDVKSVEAKIDYANMLTPWLKLEAGFAGNYNIEDSPVTASQGELRDDMQPWKEQYNRFIYHNNISALYVTLGGTVKNLSYSAGLRSESWQIRTKSLAYGESKADQDWYRKYCFALFPSAFVSYSLPHDNEIQLNYTRRIRRPWGGQLNSFRDVKDPTNIHYGNPELDPEYSNAFELNYIKSWTMHMISVSAYLRTADDVIEHIDYLEGNTMYETLDNVSKTTNSGAEIVVKDSFWRGKIDLTTTFNLYNNHLSAWSATFVTPEGKSYDISGKAQNSFAWDMRAMFSVKLPWSLSFQATGRYQSKTLTAQGSRQGGWSVDAGIRKTFGDWSISLNCRDIFDSRKFKNTVDGPDYTQYNERWRGGRRVQLTVKWAFGNMKPKRDKNRIEEEPMDGSGYGEGMF